MRRTHLSSTIRRPIGDRLLRCSDVCCGSRLCENSEVQFACRRSISISSIWKTNSAGNHYREKTIEKTILRILGSCTFSHSLGHELKGSRRAHLVLSHPKADIAATCSHLTLALVQTRPRHQNAWEPMTAKPESSRRPLARYLAQV